MPYIYVYSPSDFVGGLPDESGAAAAGGPGFNLTLTADATPTLIEINDDDLVFDEVDGSQVLASSVTIDGSSFAAGTSINTAYDLINTATGHKVTSFHFGGNGLQQGAVDGIVSTVPLEASETYSFNSERTSHRQNNEYDDYVACFATGTLITCENGLVPVQDLKPGMNVITQDSGLQPILAVASRQVSKPEILRNPNLLPIRVPSGALGSGVPHRDLLVSPQHRFLAKSPVAGRMFETDEVLISARKLLPLPGIEVAHEVQSVGYYHILFPKHEIIFAEGAPVESFYYGPVAMKTLSVQVKTEVDKYFSGKAHPESEPVSIRQIPLPKLQNRFIYRHTKNQKPLLKEGSAMT